jgi:hypothetical protein
VLLSRYRDTPGCRRCDHLDWALAQLQQVADAALAREAVERRVPAEQLLPRTSCRPCPPSRLDGAGPGERGRTLWSPPF